MGYSGINLKLRITISTVFPSDGGIGLLVLPCGLYNHKFINTGIGRALGLNFLLPGI